jgi:hypothetical protein
MDRIPSTTVAAPTSSSAVQLRRLCKQILGPNVQVMSRIQFGFKDRKNNHKHNFLFIYQSLDD